MFIRMRIIVLARDPLQMRIPSKVVELVCSNKCTLLYCLVEHSSYSFVCTECLHGKVDFMNCDVSPLRS